MRLILIALAMLAGGAAACAHEKWWNGREIDPQTRKVCCGDNDVHHLDRDQVRAVPGGWLIIPTGEVIPENRTQPSVDGEFWHFVWGGDTKCFFAPFQGT